MCVGEWSLKGYMKDIDIRVAASLPEINREEGELKCDWDAISIDDSQ